MVIWPLIKTCCKLIDHCIQLVQLSFYFHPCPFTIEPKRTLSLYGSSQPVKEWTMDNTRYLQGTRARLV